LSHFDHGAAESIADEQVTGDLHGQFEGVGAAVDLDAHRAAVATERRDRAGDQAGVLEPGQELWIELRRLFSSSAAAPGASACFASSFLPQAATASAIEPIAKAARSELFIALLIRTFSPQV
jgi:hypothetical protein